MENHRINCINCGAPLEPNIDRCAYCGTSLQPGTAKPLRLLKNKRFRMNALYPMLLGAGLTIVIYIYGFAFDDFSETQMVRMTPIWFFFIVFGLYGYFAEYLLNQMVAGEEKNMAAAYNKWLERFIKRHLLFGLILMIVLLPFSFFRTKNSLLIAFMGSVIWGILLLIFFQAIFPAL